MLDFSVIVPTYNRPDRLLRCLQALQKLDYPAGAWELFVVNDGGQHSLCAISEDLRGELPLTVLDCPHAGPAAARNAGARSARGRWLAFLDDDCRAEPDWLTQMARGFKKTGWHGLGGQLLNPYPKNIPAQTWHWQSQFFFEYLVDARGMPLLLPSNNVAYQREVFEALGGFDEQFPHAGGEDTEFGYRLVAVGYQQGYFPAAKVWHDHRTSWAAHLRMQFRYGRGAHYLRKALAANGTVAQIEMPKRRRWQYFWMIGRFLWREGAPPRVWLLLGLTSLIHYAGRRAEGLD